MAKSKPTPSKPTKKPAKKPTVKKGARSEDQGRVLQSRMQASGKTSRIKGHVGARTRRAQAKRDSKG